MDITMSLLDKAVWRTRLCYAAEMLVYLLCSPPLNSHHCPTLEQGVSHQGDTGSSGIVCSHPDPSLTLTQHNENPTRVLPHFLDQLHPFQN